MKLSKKLKSVLSFIFRCAFSLALLFYLFSIIDTEKMFAILRASDLRLIFLAFALFFGINLIILVRWLLYVKALGLNARVFDVVRYFFIGTFGNLFFPSTIGGDVIKILGLCRNSLEKPKVVASVLVDRLSGFAGMVIVATVAYLFGFRLINDSSVMISIILLALVSVVVIFALFNERIYSFCCRIFSQLPKLKKNLMRMHYDLALLKDEREAIVQAVGLSCLAQILLAFDFYLVAKALHQDIPLFSFFVFVPLICVAAALPSIAGLGVREAGAVILFTKIGVDSGVAVSISLINFLFMVMVGLIGGIFYVATISSRRVQHYQSGTRISPEEA